MLVLRSREKSPLAQWRGREFAANELIEWAQTAQAETSNSSAREQHLLVAAQELFAEQGFDRTTLRAVAEAAGVAVRHRLRLLGQVTKAAERRLDDARERGEIDASVDIPLAAYAYLSFFYFALMA